MVRDVTVVCPLADSYVALAARKAGSVVELYGSIQKDGQIYKPNSRLSLSADCSRDAWPQ